MKSFKIPVFLFIPILFTCAHLKEVKQAYQSQNYDQAIALCQTALEHNPNDEKAWLWLAKAYHAMDSTEQCTDALSELSRIESRSGNTQSEMAELYYRLGKESTSKENAFHLFEMAEKSDSNHVASVDTLAQIYERQGRYDEAIRRYDRLLLMVKDGGVYMTRANALENRIAFVESEYGKGMKALRANKLKAAEEHFKKAADTDPTHNEANFQYGYLKGNRLFEMKRKEVMDEAVEALQRAAAAKPTHAEAQYLLGKASERAGKNYLGAAIQAYQNYLRAAPYGKHAKTCRKKIQTLKKQKAFWEKG